jgi:hypothetical protein
MQVLPAQAVGLEVSGTLVCQGRFVGRTEIRRSPKEPGDVLRKHVEHFARGFPPGDALWVSRKDGEVMAPTGWQLAALHQVDLGRQLGMLSSIGGEEFRPMAPSLRAARAHPGGEVLADTVGDEKLRVLGPPRLCKNADA